ncbi:cytochrome P450 20A1-like [Dysidea avara]|uniref:cytochrome P450 20A1-like n=1 Tax=Dysidea avara TaxID=196820 RepID=UPI0033301BE3
MELVALFFGILALLAAVMFLRFRSTNRKGKPIPGWDREPTDPKMGDLGVTLENACSLFGYLWQQHGEGFIPVTSFWWRDKRVVSICSPQAFKDVQNLYERPAHIFGPISEPLHGPKSIQSVNGEEWKERRKLLHPTVRGDLIVSFIDDFVKVANELVTRWTASSEPVNLKKELFLATLKSILNTSLGNIFQDDSEIEDLANAYHACKCETDTRILNVPSPDSSREIEFQKNREHLYKYLRRMLQAQKEKKGTGKELPLMDAMLNSGNSEEIILSDMATFLGGFHTSSFYVMWTVIYLIQYPDVQEKLYNEIVEMVGDDRNEKLKAYVFTSNSYLRQFLDEAMRCSTTANVTAHYDTNQDLMVDGYCIPARTPIIYALGVAMYNSAVWECPEKFNPDRFAPGSKHAKRGIEYRPFSVSNLRRCPANQFTYAMVSVFVTVILHHCKLQAAGKQDFEKVYGIATSPKEEPFIQAELRL